VSELALRRGVKSAASILLISAGIHAAAHYHYYLSDHADDAARNALKAVMQAHMVIPAWNASAWTVLCAFSLCIALLMGLCGTAFWWMGKDMPAARLRPLATASAGLCLISALLVLLLHPIPQPVVILGGAGVCFALGSIFGRSPVAS